MDGTRYETIQVRVGDGRRVVLPAEFCERVGVREGDQVILKIDGAGIRMVPKAERVREAKEFFRRIADPSRVLSEELIASRRREVEGD